MSKVISKDEETFFSGTNFALGFTINPGIGMLWGNSDIPTTRPRIYTLVLDNGDKKEVSEIDYRRYQVGDEYP